jgi:hypothetical protein
MQNLKANVCSHSATVTTKINGRTKLVSINTHIDELLCLPHNQCQQMKAVEVELERSLIMLDLCNAMQECFTELKASAQEMNLEAVQEDEQQDCF